jgi:carboxymethylenebutenolidase
MAGIATRSMTLEGGLPAFLAMPSNLAAPAPGIVLMHERYGFVQHTRDLAERFARDGFVCIAPDCFFRHPDQAALHAGDSRYDITDGEAADLLETAVAMLEGMDEVARGCIAVKGVCQTGRHPLMLAARRPIAAALVWYGAAQDREWRVTDIYPEPLDAVIARIDCPVLGMFGEADHMISLDHVRKLRDCLERHRKSYEIHVFRGAAHGWLNDTMPGRFHREQAEAAWAVQREFLRTVFSPARDRSSVQWRFVCDSRADYDFTKNVRLE